MHINPVMVAFIHKLIMNFAAMFDNLHIPSVVMLFAKDPFTADAGGEFAAKDKKVLISLDEAPGN